MLSKGLNIVKNDVVNTAPAPPVFNAYGYGTIGANSIAVGRQYLTGSPATAPEDGTFYSVLFYGKCSEVAIMKAAIYLDDGGTPNELITKTNPASSENAIGTSDDTYEILVEPAAQISGLKYWAKVWTSAGDFTFYYDNSGDNIAQIATDLSDYPNPPDPAAGVNLYSFIMTIQIKYFK